MVLEIYLKNNNMSIPQMHKITGIPETTIRGINKRDLSKWNVTYFDAIAKTVGKERLVVMQELEKIQKQEACSNIFGKYNLENRRYIGNKNKLLNWLSKLINEHTKGKSFFDVFAGTGVVTKEMLKKYDSFIINDFLFSNNIIYSAFFGTEPYNKEKLLFLQKEFNNITTNNKDDNYFSDHFGGKFFSVHDAKIIGEIRTRIENNKALNNREYAILIASLIYSSDKIANTVGHYDAYRKRVEILDKFKFELINPLDTTGKNIQIFREDSNKLVRKVSADIAFIDPPYNSRQYSRFYHVLEGIAKWDKPKLTGVAMKPPAENMSDYSRSSAPEVFDDLIQNLNTKYIVVTYNNTYKSKSSSSKNKITHDEILNSLNKVGKTQVFEKPFQFFNAGKTDLKNHKEFVFITEVD
ncbi:DNA adenine methylase [Streptococcus equinus]|uniref:DNA adenine methylase n=1 Tax=Streptococcus equinus TaxID=1335 RepID=UPI0008D172A9|nr:DNA adenine methylase [Streptococcus equinus]SEI52299.1 adenine-specific DNA-methyltransferase [Streptococcus equinus]